MKGIIVSGSPYLWIDYHKLRDQAEIIIGVDRGVIDLLNNGITPDIAIGDFDSVSAEEFSYLSKKCPEVIKLNDEKNETDTEVAILHALSLNLTEIKLYGGLDGRVDHTMANIRLLLKFVKQGISIFLLNEKNELRVLSPGCYEFEPFKYSYLSFFALETTVLNLTLTGVKYPLTHYVLQPDDIRCISNEVILNPFKVAFSQGYLLMISSRD